jgi:hypothetical protein
MRRILLLPAVLALAACSPDDTRQAAEPPRPATVDCGTFDLKLSGENPGAAGRCLIDAVTARQPARLEIIRNTDEGDPISTTYQSAGDGRVEIVTDTRQDRFGPQRITRTTCTAIKPVDDWFEPTNCENG